MDNKEKLIKEAESLIYKNTHMFGNPNTKLEIIEKMFIEIYCKQNSNQPLKEAELKLSSLTALLRRAIKATKNKQYKYGLEFALLHAEKELTKI